MGTLPWVITIAGEIYMQKRTAGTGKIKGSVKHSSIKKPAFLKSLPESVEHIEIVQQVANVLAELQNRVKDVKAEANKELKKLLKRYESRYQDLEKKVHKVTLDAKKQAQTGIIHILQKWHEHKEKLPIPITKEIEKIIEQIGTKMAKSKSTAKKHPAVPVSVNKSSSTLKKTTTKRPSVSK